MSQRLKASGAAQAIAAVLTAILWVLLPGAAGASEDRPRVVFVNPGKTGEVFWTLVSETMKAAAAQLDIDVEIALAERSRVRMRELGLAAVARDPKPDALVLVNEEQASLEVLEAANARGIPTIMLLNDIVGSDRTMAGAPRGRLPHWLGAVIPDNRSAGTRMAEALVRFAEANGRTAPDGSIPIVALYGDTVTPASIDRNGGLKAVVERNPAVRLERELIADWDEEKAETMMDRLLARADRLGERPPAGIWAANDPIALGAVKALEAHGLEPGREVGVVGLNWSPAALEAIERGTMLMTDGGHFFGGAWVMVVLRDYFDGARLSALEPTIRFAMSPVDRSNLKSFCATIGPIIFRRSFHDIDFTRFTIGRGGQPKSYDFSLPALIAAVRTQ